MRKIIIAVVAGALLTMAWTGCSNLSNYERTNCEVVRVEEDGSLINDGSNLWKTKDRLTKGQRVDLVMNDNGSANYLQDDYIVSIRVVE